MKRIVTLLAVVMAVLGAMAQVEISLGEPLREANARVVPEYMHFTCVVGETATDTIYVYNLSSSNIYPVCGFTSSPGYIWCEPSFGNIPPGGVGKSVVTYTPEAAGTHTASMSMNISGQYYGVDMVGVATEESVEQTDMPTFECVSDNYSITVTAHGKGTVKLYLNGELVENPYMLPRSEDPYTAVFMATAQEPGKLISETALYEVSVEPLPFILPAPTLDVRQEDESTYAIYVVGEGELHLIVYGEEVSIPFRVQMASYEQEYEVEAYATATNSTPWATESEHIHETVVIPAYELPVLPQPVIITLIDEDHVTVIAEGDGWTTLYIDGEPVGSPCELPRLEEDYTVEASAQSVMDGYEESWAYMTVEVPARMMYAPAANILVSMDDEYVYVQAEGEGELTMYVDGDVVENPFGLPRLDEDYTVSVEVSNHMDGYLDEWVQEDVVVPAKEDVPPTEQTEAPSYNLTPLSPGGYRVEIVNVEPDADIYYRVKTEVDGDWVTTLWMHYDDAFVITEVGHYRVEAYAIAPGKTESSHIMCEFIIATPTICYDFIENGIYYKIINDEEVRVSKETLGSHSYSGVVTIPNTVTHDGVTYMVTSIREGAFRECAGLTAVTIGDYVTYIDQNAFRGCSNLTSVVLGDYVITVEDAAFFGCYRMTSLTLGKGLSKIGSYAFSGCSALTDITCKAATPPTMASDTNFDDSVYQSATLHVYPPVADSYKSAARWKRFKNIVGEKTVSPKPSDINGDGEVDINDVTNLIDALLNN